MSKFLTGLMCLFVFIPFFGCSQFNTVSIDQVSVQVERYTELAATVAFARADVQPYKTNICDAAASASTALANYSDPTATFASLKVVVRGAILKTNMTDAQKRVAMLVIDPVMDVTLSYVENNYKDLIAKDPVKNTLLISKAVANGLNKACNPVVSAAVPAGKLQ